MAVRYRVNGREVSAKRFRAHEPLWKKLGFASGPGAANVPSTAAWPMKSDACGCHPSQVGELRDEMARCGVKADVTPEGQVVFTSARHRKEYCEAMGFYDRNGGYSDPQRGRSRCDGEET